MISVNFRDPRPIYEQIKDDLRRLIVTGLLPTGSKLPSVREMASDLAINPSTIQRAYRELEAEGYICSQPGKGSFVCAKDGVDETRKKSFSVNLTNLLPSSVTSALISLSLSSD